MLWALVVLVPLSLAASDLPGAIALPLAVVAAARGSRRAWLHARQPPCCILIPGGAMLATCNGDPLGALTVAWRGPLAFLSWRGEGGVMHRRSFWPDTLDAGMRRELRLALMRREAATASASMAG